MGMMADFRDFAVKGNVIDLAVGVIIGGAFGKIVDSLVGDIIMPLVGAIFGTLDFSHLFLVLGNNPDHLTSLADLKKAGISVFAYGSFLTVGVNFLILAFLIFQMVSLIHRLKKQETVVVPPPATPEDVVLLREIRDALRK